MYYLMDEKDFKILELLREHGEYTTRQISKNTNLPPTTVHNRIKKLREVGIIKKFTIELDHAKINRGFMAYVMISVNLPLLKAKGKTQHDLARELKKLPFVERVDIVSGDTDIVSVVRVKDVDEFDRFLLNNLHKVEGIDRTQSLIVIHSN